ncbi:MAG: CDP-glucose 4,6-dehydratase [Verrucomicrobiia bacterium]
MNERFQEVLRRTYAGKRVWVSGHTGFKGAWLCQWLLSLGAEVFGYSLPGKVTEPSLFEQLNLAAQLVDGRGDLRDGQGVNEALRQAEPDFVFHLAAQPLVRLSYQEPVATWQTNVVGTIHVLEALRSWGQPCVAVLITTDKVYENREWVYGYREDDPLGGHDPYSASKAAAELAIASWQRSFFSHHPVKLASARAGNVMGGGDWASDRIVPDAMRALAEGRPVPVRNPASIRPWQHVLEPLAGYLLLGARLEGGDERMAKEAGGSMSFNFGPSLESNRTVTELVEEILRNWSGCWEDHSEVGAPHEAGRLSLATDKAFHLLGWQPRWSFTATVEKTVGWYRAVHLGADPVELTLRQIEEYGEI